MVHWSHNYVTIVYTQRWSRGDQHKQLAALRVEPKVYALTRDTESDPEMRN